MSNEIETNLDESSVTANARNSDPQKKLENDGSVSLVVCKTSVVLLPKTAALTTIVTSIRLSRVATQLLFHKTF